MDGKAWALSSDRKNQMTTLPTLKARLEQADGPDRELDAEILCAFDGYIDVFDVGDGDPLFTPKWNDGTQCNEDDFTASLDACIALVERKLPNWRWYVDDKHAAIWPREHELYFDLYSHQGRGANPAISLLIALVTAMTEDGHLVTSLPGTEPTERLS